MSKIENEIRVNCEPEQVWRVLADLESVQSYNPTVRLAEICGEPRTGVGATRRCELEPSGAVTERVTHWEEGTAIGLEVIVSDWPIVFMRWVTRLEPEAGQTRISQQLEYQVKFGPLGWLLDKLVMRRKLRSTLDEVFERLKTHAEGSSISTQ